MNRPAPVGISYENMHFLITHNPTNATLNKFTEELKKYGVTTVVRVCDATYDKAPVEKEGIHVLEDVVHFIRPKRRGAFNSKQLLYLEKYRPKMRLRFRDTNGHCCIQWNYKGRLT
uniref:Protein tyrosine phosphatase type IVA 2-like n=1 Tax=Jaculus jaculus TaxID=51337 RepID=A0A8C5KBV0_JACJA